MFAQGSTSSPFRSSGQQGLFSTSQLQSSFAQSSSTSGYGGYSNTSSSTPNTFAGPQFGGGNHGAAYGGHFGGAGASVGSGGGAGGAGYGSPFGGAGGMQSSTSGARGTPGAKRSYLPGYLSGGVAAQQAESTPPQSGPEERGWDSPARRTSVSGSPAARFGGGSLFGIDVGTQPKSPKFMPYTAPPRATAYRQEVEEDAPPIASLNEFHSGDQPGLQVDSSMNSLGRSPSNDPTASPFASTSAPLHSPPSSAEGYAVNVFGFPASASDLILDFFSQFGDIVSKTPSTEGGNWVTIVYAQPWSAARAVRKNGEVLGGVLMVGVKAVDEDGLRWALAGGEGGNEVVPTSQGTSRTHTPVSTSTPSGVGRPVNVLGPQVAFKAAPTPARKGFFGLGGGASGGTPGGGADAHASLFAEKSKQAVLAQQQQGQGQKGVLGRVSDLVFGW
ncbi:nucleoporin Nup40 [Rhodotorula toruloides]|uniref:Nucleoporin Nup40 n=1 Tax=Rhodotorula toruloides TaxID=5286 RepID=A0A511KAT5_RHOTO|nr:nucleoporin Nup40 [Rhodotorula toruloides]